MRTFKQIIISIAFLALLFACLIGTVFKWDLYEVQENRKLAEFPAFKTLPLDEWPMAFEDYFDDHFGFRNTFIRRYNKLMRKMAKSNRVEFGTQQWLFLNHPPVMNDYMGRTVPDAQELEQLSTRLNSRIEWLQQRDIPYLLIVIPNKVTVYSEFLSGPLPKLKGKTFRESMHEDFAGRFDAHLLDLTPMLMEAKNEEVVYLKTDTHWNRRGTFLGYSAIMDRIQTILPDLPEKKIKFEDLIVETIPNYEGDLATLSGMPGKYPLTTIKTTNPAAATWSTNELTQAVFLKEENMPLINKPPYTIHNPNGKYNVVIFHDSFCMSLQDLLCQHFRNTTFIWRYSNAELIQAAVEFCKPDLVIEEGVERFLSESPGGVFPDELVPLQEK
jgi:alginate O-acetyltransferase complex protein AlgJ